MNLFFEQAKHVGKFNEQNVELDIYTFSYNTNTYKTSRDDTKILIPMLMMHRFNNELKNFSSKYWVSLFNEGIRNIVFHERLWNGIKSAQEITIISSSKTIPLF